MLSQQVEGGLKGSPGSLHTAATWLFESFSFRRLSLVLFSSSPQGEKQKAGKESRQAGRKSLRHGRQQRVRMFPGHLPAAGKPFQHVAAREGVQQAGKAVSSTVVLAEGGHSRPPGRGRSLYNRSGQ